MKISFNRRTYGFWHDFCHYKQLYVDSVTSRFHAEMERPVLSTWYSCSLGQQSSSYLLKTRWELQTCPFEVTRFEHSLGVMTWEKKVKWESLWLWWLRNFRSWSNVRRFYCGHVKSSFGRIWDVCAEGVAQLMVAGLTCRSVRLSFFERLRPATCPSVSYYLILVLWRLSETLHSFEGRRSLVLKSRSTSRTHPQNLISSIEPIDHE